MKMHEFIKLPRKEQLDNFSDMKEGDRFLYGRYMQAQLETKKPGDEVSFYRVIKIKENSAEYIIDYDILQKDKIEI